MFLKAEETEKGIMKHRASKNRLQRKRNASTLFSLKDVPWGQTRVFSNIT